MLQGDATLGDAILANATVHALSVTVTCSAFRICRHLIIHNIYGFAAIISLQQLVAATIVTDAGLSGDCIKIDEIQQGMRAAWMTPTADGNMLYEYLSLLPCWISLRGRATA